MIGEIHLFSKVVDRFRGIQRDEQRVLKTVRDESIRDRRDNVVSLVEDIERIDHSKRKELASAVFLSLDLLEDALPLEVGLPSDQAASFRLP